MDVLVIDCDYVYLEEEQKPLLRIFGKSGRKSVCVFFKGPIPYFYVLPKKDVIEKLKKSKEVFKIVKIKKFLPIGFQQKETELFKVFLKNPEKTREVREIVRQNKLGEIFEADIPFKYRFMADYGIRGMGWIRVDGESTSTNLVKTDLVLEAKRIEAIEKDGEIPLKYLSLDIEVLSEELPNPEKDPIILISLCFLPPFKGKNTLVLVAKPVKKEADILPFPNEKEMLTEFLKIVEEFDPDVIIGYNISAFDLPYLLQRLKVLNLPRTLGRCRKKKAVCKKLKENYYKPSVLGRIVADPFLLIKEMGKRGFFRGLKRFGLDEVAKNLLGEEKIEIVKSKINEFWKKDVKKLIDYCRRDAELAFKLVIKLDLLAKHIALSRVTGLLLQDTLYSGEAQKVENLLLREFNRRNYVIPCKPTEAEMERRKKEREAKGFKGAFVLKPETGLHTSPIIYLDFASMYPNIFISFNICPTTLIYGEEKNVIKTPYGTTFVSPTIKKGIFPQILKKLIEERKKVKTFLKTEKDKERRAQLDAKQEALKRVANAFYGYTGFLAGKFYVLDIANAITSCGREFIKQTKAIVEKNTSHKVVYGDTDSVMIKVDCSLEEAFKAGDELAKLINEKLENKLQMKVESIFSSLLILTKKRYVGVSIEKIGDEYKEKLVMKGIETVRRDWCDLVSETLEEILRIILKEKNPEKALEYFKNIIKKLQEGKINLEKLVITKGISKRLEEYKGVQPHVELIRKMKQRGEVEVPGVGDRVGFVIVKGPELVSKRAEDPRYVIENNLEIDVNYYVYNQLFPPLERIFEVIGFEKTQILGKGKQTLLNQVAKPKQTKIEEWLENFENFACGSCGKKFLYPPLLGKCLECGGEIYFQWNGRLAKKLRVCT